MFAVATRSLLALLCSNFLTNKQKVGKLALTQINFLYFKWASLKLSQM